MLQIKVNDMKIIIEQIINNVIIPKHSSYHMLKCNYKVQAISKIFNVSNVSSHNIFKAKLEFDNLVAFIMRKVTNYISMLD